MSVTVDMVNFSGGKFWKTYLHLLVDFNYISTPYQVLFMEDRNVTFYIRKNCKWELMKNGLDHFDPEFLYNLLVQNGMEERFADQYIFNCQKGKNYDYANSTRCCA